MTAVETRTREPSTVAGNWLLGSAREVLGDPLNFALRIFNEHGDVVRFDVGPPALRRRYYMVCHPDGAAQVLNAPANRNYRKDHGFYTPVRELFGNGLLTSQGELWRRQRRIIQPLFTPASVDGYAETMTAAVARLAARWRAKPDVQDLRTAMSGLTLDVVMRILFGADADRMAPVVRSEFPVLYRASISRAVAPIQIPLGLPTPSNLRIARAERRINRLCDDLIARRRTAADAGTDLVGRLVSARDDTGDTLSEAEIRDQLKVFLFTGHDTTSTALTFALHLVGKHPQAQSRIREEVARTLGDSPSSATEIRALDYTTMVLKEATRLYPSAPFIPRNSVDESVVCGSRLPAGSDISLSPWVIHHRSDLWPDPYRFDPLRFEGDAVAERHPLAWMPFGHGPRGCIGQRFAMLEATTALALLVRDFNFVTPPGEVKLTCDIVLHAVGAVPCHIERRTLDDSSR